MMALVLAGALTLPIAEVAEVQDLCARKYPGRVKAVARVDIRPQVSGEILKVAFSNGQEVARGDLLYSLDPVQYKAAVQTAEARRDEAKTTLAYAELKASRYERLVKTRAVSQDDFDHACSNRDVGRSTLAAAEAALAAARDDLAHCRIVAPIAGRVGSTVYTEGNYLQKGGEALVSLVQVRPIRVKFRISSVDYRAFRSNPERIVQAGRVEVRLTEDDRMCATGGVEYVENVADEKTDTIGVFARLENADGRFLDGQTVMVTLSNTEGRRFPAVPPNAVAQDLLGPYVWVLDEAGRAAQRRIERGRLVGGLLSVLSGLTVGERVVADGVHRVRQGMTIVAESGT